MCQAATRLVQAPQMWRGDFGAAPKPLSGVVLPFLVAAAPSTSLLHWAQRSDGPEQKAQDELNGLSPDIAFKGVLFFSVYRRDLNGTASPFASAAFRTTV